MNFGCPSSARFPNGLRAVFFRAPVPSGCTLTIVLSMEIASILMRTSWARCHSFKNTLQHALLGPAAQPRVDRMPIPKSLREAAPLAAVLGDEKNGVQDIQILELDVAALPWQAMFDSFILFCADFHA